MDNVNFKVYVKTDSNNRITAINSSNFIKDLTDWIYIDEGVGDKYHHAQNNYFKDGIYDMEGIPKYQLLNGEIVDNTYVDLEKFKNRKLNELENAFNLRVKGSFTCSLGYPMQFNRTDCIAVEGAIRLIEAKEGTFGYLTDANDETHLNVSLSNMKTVLIEMLSTYAMCHSRKQDLRTEIANAITKEDLDAIEFVWNLS